MSALHTHLTPAPIAPRTRGPRLPVPRGPLTAFLCELLAQPAHRFHSWPQPSDDQSIDDPASDDPIWGEDAALALYCCYELHYRGFAGVDEHWEWEPSLLTLRRSLEEDFLARTIEVVGSPSTQGDIAAELRQLIQDSNGRSLARFAARRATATQFKELAVHRSAYQLKEADPHTWAIPRLWGAPKAALVEIQQDEYGDGVQKDMHAELFAVTLRELGLDDGYGTYLDLIPAVTLATVNLASLFGLHRRWRGALVGHLAVFEMTSVEPMGQYSAGLRRLGFNSWARLFFDTHVVADATHQFVAANKLAAGLVAQEPELADDILFGAHALMKFEAEFSRHVFECWDAQRSSLRVPL